MKNANTLSGEVRYCADIGMWALDRPILSSCVHKTDFCADTCFNNKLYKLYPAMEGKDIRNEAAWEGNDSAGLATTMGRKKKGSKNRFRLMTRGEAISSFADIDRIINLAVDMPGFQIWIPSRSWRNPVLFAAAMQAFASYKNIIVLASMDPSNTSDEWAHVKNLGMSTMFFGTDDMKETPNGDRMFMCPKTHKHLNGHCGICKGGCFNTKKRVDVHLSQH